MRSISLTGKRFGQLRVINSTSERKCGQIVWHCVCDCGNFSDVKGHNLTHGFTKSCGCLISTLLRRRNTTHGKSKSPEYVAWHLMRQRCLNPKATFFQRYGGRGIVVCDRWNDFSSFLEDMGLRPSPRHSLNRLDNDGPYSPDNCAWSTKLEQARNTSGNVHVVVGGVKMTKSEAAEKAGISNSTFWARLDNGWSVDEAIAVPLRKTCWK